MLIKLSGRYLPPVHYGSSRSCKQMCTYPVIKLLMSAIIHFCLHVLSHVVSAYFYVPVTFLQSTYSTVMRQTCPHSYNGACGQPWVTYTYTHARAEEMSYQVYIITRWSCYEYTAGYIEERTRYTGKYKRHLEGEGGIEDGKQEQIVCTGTYGLGCSTP